LNHVLREIVLIIMLLGVLGFTSHKTLEKAFSLYAKESIAIKRVAQKTDSEEFNSLLENGRDEENKSESVQYGTIDLNEKQHETQKFHALSQQSDKPGYVEETSFEVTIDRMHSFWCAIKLSTLFVVVTAVRLVERDSFLGPSYHCGQMCALLWQGATILTIFAFSCFVRCQLLHRLKSGLSVESDIAWNETTTIKYPAFAIIAGLIAGLFGIGGGLVYGPLMLSLDVHPAVASATSSCMILFVSSTATISYISYGYLVYDYALACFLVGLFSTFLGQILMSYLLQRFKRNSYIAFSIGIVVAISTVCMTVESIMEIRNE